MKNLSYNNSVTNCAIRLLIVYAVAGKFSLAISKHDNFKEKSNVTSTEECSLYLTPLQYEINIEPIIFPKGSNESGNSPENGVVSAWAKIRVLASPAINCTNNTTGHTIRLNTRGCKIDTDKAEITLNGTVQHLTFKNWSIHADDGQEYIQIQIEGPIDSGAEIHVYLPYTLETTRHYFEERWQGLYFYQKKRPEEFKTKWEIYHYFPLHAQFIFPVFENDEKNASSDSEQNPTFKIHVARNEAYGFVTISNSYVQNTTRLTGREGWVVDHFRETPPLPIDQVTVMILKGFQNHTVYDIASKDNTSISINLWIFDKGTDNKSPFINSTANKILALFQFFREKFILTEYPLNKLDFVVVPWEKGLYFHANLGLVAHTALEDLYLDQEGERAPLWLSLNIAYQWLGGVVSFRISEGDYRDMLLGPKDRAVGLLQYVSTWPFVKNETSLAPRYHHSFPDNVETVLLQMLQQVFGIKVMESAIGDFYLPKMVWKKARPEHVYDAIQEAVEFHNLTHPLPETGPGEDPITMRDIYESWSGRSSHYPRIDVDIVVGGEDNASLLTLSQQNFNNPHNIPSASGSTPSKLWWLPVKILTQSGESILIWLSTNERNASFQLENGKEDQWLILNPDGSGVYKVQYSHDIVILCVLVRFMLL